MICYFNSSLGTDQFIQHGIGYLWINVVKNVLLRPLLVESSVIVIFMSFFLCAMRQLLIVSYFGEKKLFATWEKKGGKQLF